MARVRAGEAGSDGVALTAFVVMVVGIGGNIVAIKYILRAGDLDPLWAAASRFLLAAMLFAIISQVVRARFPRGRALAGAALYGALSIGGFFAFAYWGLQEAPAGMAGVMLATSPLLTFLFALAHGQERFRWDSAIGAAVVVAGTAVVLSAGVDQEVPIPSMLAILVSSACAAEGTVVVKAFPAVAPAMRNAVAMAVGSVMLLVLVPLAGESIAVPRTAETWTAQVYLVLIGTIGVFSLYLYLLGRWTASAVSYEFVTAPLVGILLAAWLLDEPVTRTFAVGSILILGGVYLGVIRQRRVG